MTLETSNNITNSTFLLSGAFMDYKLVNYSYNELQVFLLVTIQYKKKDNIVNRREVS